MEEESSSAILAPAELDLPRYAIVGAGGTDRGHRHEINEDCFAIEPTHTGGVLLVVCDGMGGMGRGDQASSLAMCRLVEALTRAHNHPLDAATAAIHAVDRELVRTFDDDAGKRPGTTCAIVHVEGGMAYVSWVGDSSVLVVRAGHVVAQTRPHRVVQDLVDAGAMTPEEARTSPMARYLARSLGGRSPDEPVVEPSMLRPWRLAAGDAVVVCSDGLTDFLAPDEIASVVARHADEHAAVGALVELALARGVDDNVTVVVARCVDADAHAHAGFLAPPWEHVALTDHRDEPDYHSDIRGHALPPDPVRHAVRAPSPVAVAAAVFAVGAAAMFLALGLWFALG